MYSVATILLLLVAASSASYISQLKNHLLDNVHGFTSQQWDAITYQDDGIPSDNDRISLCPSRLYWTPFFTFRIPVGGLGNAWLSDYNIWAFESIQATGDAAINVEGRVASRDVDFSGATVNVGTGLTTKPLHNIDVGVISNNVNWPTGTLGAGETVFESAGSGTVPAGVTVSGSCPFDVALCIEPSFTMAAGYYAYSQFKLSTAEKNVKFTVKQHQDETRLILTALEEDADAYYTERIPDAVWNSVDKFVLEGFPTDLCASNLIINIGDSGNPIYFNADATFPWFCPERTVFNVLPAIGLFLNPPDVVVTGNVKGSILAPLSTISVLQGQVTGFLVGTEVVLDGATINSLQCRGGSKVFRVGCNTDNDFDTIQEGIDSRKVVKGDILTVCPGKYAGDINLTKSIVLLGCANEEDCLASQSLAHQSRNVNMDLYKKAMLTAMSPSPRLKRFAHHDVDEAVLEAQMGKKTQKKFKKKWKKYAKKMKKVYGEHWEKGIRTCKDGSCLPAEQTGPSVTPGSYCGWPGVVIDVTQNLESYCMAISAAGAVVENFVFYGNVGSFSERDCVTISAPYVQLSFNDFKFVIPSTAYGEEPATTMEETVTGEPEEELDFGIVHAFEGSHHLTLVGNKFRNQINITTLDDVQTQEESPAILQTSFVVVDGSNYYPSIIDNDFAGSLSTFVNLKGGVFRGSILRNSLRTFSTGNGFEGRLVRLGCDWAVVSFNHFIGYQTAILIDSDDDKTTSNLTISYNMFDHNDIGVSIGLGEDRITSLHIFKNTFDNNRAPIQQFAASLYSIIEIYSNCFDHSTYSMISLLECSSLVVSKNLFRYAGGDFISAQCSKVTVDHNDFIEAKQNGIELTAIRNSNYYNILNNGLYDILGAAIWIHANSSDAAPIHITAKVQSNDVAGVACEGLLIEDTLKLNVDGNTISDIGADGITVKSTKDATVSNNYISDSWRYGIQLDLEANGDALVEGNEIDNTILAAIFDKSGTAGTKIQNSVITNVLLNGIIECSESTPTLAYNSISDSLDCGILACNPGTQFIKNDDGVRCDKEDFTNLHCALCNCTAPTEEVTIDM